MTVALLSGLQIADTPTTLYTAATQGVIVSAILMNPTPAATTVTVLIAHAGGGSTPIVTGLPLLAHQAHVATEIMGRTLAVGDAVMAMAGGSVIATLAIST